MTNEDEKKLFRQAVGTVKPLRDEKVTPTKQLPRPRILQREKDTSDISADGLSLDSSSSKHEPGEHEMGGHEMGEHALYAVDGLQRKSIRKLQRGQYNIQAEADLHGLTREQARDDFSLFFDECLTRQLRCIKIIHGKGFGSRNNAPVLKPLVQQWLRQKHEVLAFCPAIPSDGGTGAVYVLLRSTR
ncbi:MAG: Smr/MutS family protein [Gammaproteobacteria bacterium]|nr:Smr/MutS family protein [Gammaproteobacteria bacterium]